MNWHLSMNGHIWYHSSVTGCASNLGSMAALQKPPTAPPATTQLEKHVIRRPWETGGQKLSGGWSVVSTRPCAVGFTPQAQSISHPLAQTLSLGCCVPLSFSTLAPGLSSCSPELMAGARTPSLFLCCYQGMNSVSEHGTVWKKPSEVTPSSFLHHFDFHCVSCAVLGNSGLSNINQLFYMAFRCVLGR